MKKILLFIAVLLSLSLTGCIQDNDNDDSLTDFQRQQLEMMDYSYDRMGLDADTTYPDMMYGYYYGEVWDTCTINGVEYTNVSIIYTSLGLAYQIEKNEDGAFTRVFMPDLLIEHCEVEIQPLDLGTE